jgi:hypothetical protein
MHISNLFENKAYAIPILNQCDDEQKQIVNLILSSFEPRLNTNDIELISYNENYDSYKFIYNEESFCIKISLDANCPELIHEANALKTINNLIKPLYVHDGTIKIGDELRYLVTSYENALSIFSSGISELIGNFDNFCESYKFLQESTLTNYTYKDHLDKIFKQTDLNNIFTDNALLSLKTYSKYEIIEDILKNIKSEILNSYSDFMSKKTHICHGNLNLNNILTRDRLFKFINFDNVYYSHCFMDLAELIIELGINQSLEIKLIEQFCQNLDIEYTPENINLYKKCYKIILNQKALIIIIEYLKETYLYSCHRRDRIIKICDKFSKYYDRFLQIKIFHEHRDFIMKTLTEPVLNQKA